MYYIAKFNFTFYHTFEYQNKDMKLTLFILRMVKLNAIEVKSTKRFTLSSLDKLKEKYLQIK